ncbi:hypothetical protein EFA59_02490 [Weissella hellenica]|nr:hypothetical protein EFA59_02490 [Weissella hellenica]
MAEIITYLIVSGGLGFFNLYITQESDLLYFGKYNKEERLAWLSIYSIINFLTIRIILSTWNMAWLLLVKLLIITIIIISNLLITFILPYLIDKIIKIVRHIRKLGNRTYLPPLNTFFQDIKDYELYVYDFNGKIVNHGKLEQGTEERQLELSVLLLPTTPNIEFDTYEKIITILSDNKENISYEEYIDYDRKYHFIKIKIKKS